MSSLRLPFEVGEQVPSCHRCFRSERSVRVNGGLLDVTGSTTSLKATRQMIFESLCPAICDQHGQHADTFVELLPILGDRRGGLDLSFHVIGETMADAL